MRNSAAPYFFSMEETPLEGHYSDRTVDSQNKSSLLTLDPGPVSEGVSIHAEQGVEEGDLEGTWAF